MDIFWKFKHFNQYFLTQMVFLSFSLPNTITNFLLLLWNYFLILKMLTGNSHSPHNSLSVIGRCWPLFGCRENAQELTCHRWLLVWLYWITGGFLYAFSDSKLTILGFWKGLLKEFSKLVVISREFAYFINKEILNCKNHQRMYRKYLFNIINLKKNILHVTQFLLAVV